MRDPRDEPDDELLPRLFQALGPQPELPEAMKRSWEATFGRELMRQNARRHRRRQLIVGVACAATLLVAFAASLFVGEHAAPAPAAHVVMARGLSESTVPGAATARLNDGDAIATDATILTGPHASLALRYHGTDVRLKSDTVVVVHRTRLQLTHGEIYVDAGPTPTHGAPLTIETRFGTLEHVGTQFLVAVTDDEMRAAVREGAIAMEAGGQRRTISAADGAHEAVVTADSITIKKIPAAGGSWAWVAAAAPTYLIDGATADAFLHWVARQLGAELHYADSATATHARLVTLHGDLHASVAQGLAIIDGTTDLAINRTDPAILLVRTRTQP
jgi:ferric-dicitrate binding protein FerR (iron transport regulator)